MPECEHGFPMHTRCPLCRRKVLELHEPRPRAWSGGHPHGYGIPMPHYFRDLVELHREDARRERDQLVAEQPELPL